MMTSMTTPSVLIGVLLTKAAGPYRGDIPAHSFIKTWLSFECNPYGCCGKEHQVLGYRCIKCEYKTLNLKNLRNGCNMLSSLKTNLRKEYAQIHRNSGNPKGL